MNTTYLAHWHGQCLQRIGGSEELFVDGGEVPDVFKRFEVVRMHPVLVIQLPVGGNVGVGMMQRPAQSLKLERSDLVVTVELFGVGLAAILRGCRRRPRLRDLV